MFDFSMNSKITVKNWHRAIIADAEGKLGRPLQAHERDFITSRGSFMALEMIHDTVKAVGRGELETYLSSEQASGSQEGQRPVLIPAWGNAPCVQRNESPSANGATHPPG